MTRHSQLPPATAFTIGDRLRLLFGALVLALGIAIVWRLAPLGITLQGLLVGGAFIGFGAYRLWLGYTRLREWKREGGTND